MKSGLSATLAVLSIIALSTFGTAFAATPSPSPSSVTPTNLSSTEKAFEGITSMEDLIVQLYNYSLSVVGICVFGMFMYSGIVIMLEGAGAKKKAIKIMQNAVIGTVLLYSAYIIFNSINHDIVEQKAVSGVTTK